MELQWRPTPGLHAARPPGAVAVEAGRHACLSEPVLTDGHVVHDWQQSGIYAEESAKNVAAFF